MRYQVTKTYRFSAAHRVEGVPGGCSRVHGHNYTAQLTLESSSLDKNGMVLDFRKMKLAIAEFIDENLDHNLILSASDKIIGHVDDLAFIFGRVPFIMPEIPEHQAPKPTTEALACVLFMEARRRLSDYFPEVTVHSVRLWETEDNFCEVFEC